MKLLKKKLRRLRNKLKIPIREAYFEAYGHRIILDNGDEIYRDKKGWLHYTPPLTGQKA